MSITSKISRPLHFTIDRFRDQHRFSGFIHAFHRNVTCRGGFILALICTPITSALDIIFGSLASIASIVTGGCIPSINVRAYIILINGGEGLLSATFLNFLKFINPHANFKIDQHHDRIWQMGILSYYVFAKKIRSLVENLKSSDRFIKKHIFSRILFLTTIVISCITRIIDLVIGIFAAIGAILTLGKFHQLNATAFRGLKFSLIFGDLAISLLFTINPFAKIYDKSEELS